jgi:hypothetical protein
MGRAEHGRRGTGQLLGKLGELGNARQGIHVSYVRIPLLLILGGAYVGGGIKD